MEYTSNLKLKKPARADQVLIGDLNDNMDILDQEITDVWDILDNAHAVLTTTLDTAWQGSEAPYIKTQTVNGLLATDTPIVDVIMSGDYTVDEARIEAWGYVYRITTADNAITLYASEKPAISLPIQLKVVR